MGEIHMGGVNRRTIWKTDQEPFTKNATGPNTEIKRKCHFLNLRRPVRITEATGRNGSLHESVPFLDR